MITQKPSKALLVLLCSFVLVSCNTTVKERQDRAQEVITTTVQTASGMTQTIADYIEALKYVGENLVGSVNEGVTEVKGRVDAISEGVNKIKEGKELLEEGVYGTDNDEEEKKSE